MKTADNTDVYDARKKSEIVIQHISSNNYFYKMLFEDGYVWFNDKAEIFEFESFEDLHLQGVPMTESTLKSVTKFLNEKYKSIRVCPNCGCEIYLLKDA